MDEIEEIKKRKMERMMMEMNKPPAPSIELPKKTIIATDETVDKMASQYPLFILDCWAEWCGPCRSVGPIIDQLAVEMAGKVVFGKLNVDQNIKTANKHRISAIPTLLVFKNGKLIDQIVGAYPKPALAAKLQKYL